MQISESWWAQLLFAAAAITVLLLTWLGWRAGVVRQLVSLAGFFAAILVGFAARALMVPLLRPLGLPVEQLAFIGAAALALVIYGIVVLLSAILLKNTAQQGAGILRIIYGFFGALIGFAKGLFLVWAGCIVLRLVGTVAEVQVALARRPSSAQARERPPQRDATIGTTTRAFAEMKRALDGGRIGAVLDRVDPFANSFRRSLPKLVRVLSDDRRVQRFRAHPGVRKLVNHPKIIALQRDREFTRAVAERNVPSLLRNPRLQAVLNDSELRTIADGVDLEGALDDALGETRR